MKQVTPPWANKTEINRIYRQAKKMRKRGIDVNVDHIVPLNHPHVSGLHCPANLRICYRAVNAAKGNRHWPNMWHEPEWLDLPTFGPHQLKLL